jgi:hypothetical protein
MSPTSLTSPYFPPDLLYGFLMSSMRATYPANTILPAWITLTTTDEEQQL